MSFRNFSFQLGVKNKIENGPLATVNEVVASVNTAQPADDADHNSKSDIDDESGTKVENDKGFTMTDEAVGSIANDAVIENQLTIDREVNKSQANTNRDYFGGTREDPSFTWNKSTDPNL